MQVDKAFFHKILFTTALLSMIAFAAGTIAYTLPIAFFGIYATNEAEKGNGDLMVPFIGLHSLGLLLDLIIMSSEGAQVFFTFAIVISSFNFVVKVIVFYCWHQFRLQIPAADDSPYVNHTGGDYPSKANPVNALTVPDAESNQQPYNDL
jgi:hypothetical protein